MTMSQARHYEMKDSGVEWIGKMPKAWQYTPLKYLASCNDEVLTEATPEDYTFDYIDIGSVHTGNGIGICERIQFKDAPSRARRIVRDGDIIVSTVRTYLKAIAQVGNYDVPHIASTGFAVIRTKNANASFLKYALLSDNFVSQVEADSVGISYPAINASQIMAFKIPVPSIAEQTAIAAYLGERCATIDAIVAEAKATIEEYKAWKASVIFEAVTKGLNPNAAMKESGVEWIGEMPKHWITKRGKNILRLLSRPVRPDDEIVTCFRDGEVTLRKNRREEGFTNALVEAGYQGVEPGDLVVHGMDGFAGSIGVSDSRGKASPVLNVMDSSENKRYLMYYLRGIAMREVFLALSTGIRVRSCDLRWNKLAVLPYIVPPLPEQTAIAAYLDSKCAAIDSVIAEKEALISDLETYKKSLIFETVTGKRRVC